MKSIPAAMLFSSGEYTGADSYTDLTHKPRINDVELSGIKSSADLGLADASTTYTKTEVDDLLDDKVNKVDGKGLSTNDYDNTAKDIVNGVTEALALKADADDVYTKTEVDDLLDDKVNNTDIVTSFGEESSDEKIPSEKLVKTNLDELNVKLPDAPDTDGTYTLKVTVTDGVPSYNWFSD